MNPAELALLDAVISQQLDVFRLSAAKRAQILRRLARLERELVNKLAVTDMKRGERRKLARFLKATGEVIAEAYTKAQGELEFGAVAETIAKLTANDLAVVLGPIEPEVRLPTADFYAAVASDAMVEGVPQAQWWRAQAEATRRAFEGAIRQGLASNETNQQLIARIVGKDGVGGVMSVARYQAAALVQTGVSSVANTARLATFRANSDIVIGVRQVSTLDSHTSKICIAYSGAAWDLDGQPIRGTTLAFNNGPPRHFNCRSVLVPILKTFKQLGLDVGEIKPATRASDEGQISAATTFNAFLSRKSFEYQNEVLGVGRADLWRAGKITLRDLVSGDGRPLTLAELRRKAGLD